MYVNVMPCIYISRHTIIFIDYYITVVPYCVVSSKYIGYCISPVLYLLHWCQDWNYYVGAVRDYEGRL